MWPDYEGVELLLENIQEDRKELSLASFFGLIAERGGEPRFSKEDQVKFVRLCTRAALLKYLGAAHEPEGLLGRIWWSVTAAYYNAGRKLEELNIWLLALEIRFRGKERTPQTEETHATSSATLGLVWSNLSTQERLPAGFHVEPLEGATPVIIKPGVTILLPLYVGKEPVLLTEEQFREELEKVSLGTRMFCPDNLHDSVGAKEAIKRKIDPQASGRWIITSNGRTKGRRWKWKSDKSTKPGRSGGASASGAGGEEEETD